MQHSVFSLQVSHRVPVKKGIVYTRLHQVARYLPQEYKLSKFITSKKVRFISVRVSDEIESVHTPWLAYRVDVVRKSHGVNRDRIEMCLDVISEWESAFSLTPNGVRPDRKDPVKMRRDVALSLLNMIAVRSAFVCQLNLASSPRISIDDRNYCLDHFQFREIVRDGRLRFADRLNLVCDVRTPVVTVIDYQTGETRCERNIQFFNDARVMYRGTMRNSSYVEESEGCRYYEHDYLFADRNHHYNFIGMSDAYNTLPHLAALVAECLNRGDEYSQQGLTYEWIHLSAPLIMKRLCKNYQLFDYNRLGMMVWEIFNVVYEEYNGDFSKAVASKYFMMENTSVEKGVPPTVTNAVSAIYWIISMFDQDFRIKHSPSFRANQFKPLVDVVREIKYDDLTVYVRFRQYSKPRNFRGVKECDVCVKSGDRYYR